jgi:dTDP-L-rhamnose 4-epimerase
LFEEHGLPSLVVHLAAETGTGQSLTQASRHGIVNVVGTTELIDAMTRRDHRPDHVVLTSSRAVYGEGAWRSRDGSIFYPPPRTEVQLRAGQWDPSDPDGHPGTVIGHDASSVWPRPTNVYAATKLAQEHILEAWSAAFDVPLTILRLQNVYGPGQAVGNAYTGVLTFFAAELSRGHALDVYEDGQILRDFVFVGDVVDAIVATVDRPPVGTRRVDIGSGAPVSLLEVAQAMTRIAGGPPPVVSGRYRNGDVRAAFADISAARHELDWTPRISLESGLTALSDSVHAQLRA